MPEEKEKETNSRYIIDSGFYMGEAKPTRMEDGSKVYAQLGLSAKAGTRQVLVMIKLLDHDVTLPWFGYFTPDSAERTIQSLRLLGWKGNSFDDLATAELPAKVSVTVEKDKYKGKIRARVAWINDPDGPGIVLEQQMNKKDVLELNKDFKELLKA